MVRKEIEEKVNAFLIEDLEIEEENVYPESLLKEDMGIDSLDYVDIVVSGSYITDSDDYDSRINELKINH